MFTNLQGIPLSPRGRKETGVQKFQVTSEDLEVVLHEDREYSMERPDVPLEQIKVDKLNRQR